MRGNVVYKPIPTEKMPGIYSINDFSEETFVSIKEATGGRVLEEPVYFNLGIKGAENCCKIRTGTAKRLITALEMLPSGLTFKVYDAWRSAEVQQTLFDRQMKENIKRGFSEEQAIIETRKFVSHPSYDERQPAVHSTGGAIDLTIVDIKTGCELNMGTEFDDFSPKAYTAYFENSNDTEIRNNRRLLYHAMISAGFTNLPSEWWHFDYGDAFWAFYKKSPIIYKGKIK